MNNEPIMTPDKKDSSADMPINEQPSHFGLIIGVLVIVLALILMGLYIWGRLMLQEPVVPNPSPQRPTAEENNEPESTTAEARAEVLDIMSSSDELDAIEADLNGTRIGDIDTDINAIDAELGN